MRIKAHSTPWSNKINKPTQKEHSAQARDNSSKETISSKNPCSSARINPRRERKHGLVYTSKGKVYVCKMCSERFVQSYALANHVKSFCPYRPKKVSSDKQSTRRKDKKSRNQDDEEYQINDTNNTRKRKRSKDNTEDIFHEEAKGDESINASETNMEGDKKPKVIAIRKRRGKISKISYQGVDEREEEDHRNSPVNTNNNNNANIPGNLVSNRDNNNNQESVQGRGGETEASKKSETITKVIMMSQESSFEKELLAVDIHQLNVAELLHQKLQCMKTLKEAYDMHLISLQQFQTKQKEFLEAFIFSS